jgi:hypothetical protein
LTLRDSGYRREGGFGNPAQLRGRREVRRRVWRNKANLGVGRFGCNELRTGGRLGADAFQVFEGALVGARGGIDAALEPGEELEIAAVGFGERGVLIIVVTVAMKLALPDFGFGTVEAAEEPVVGDEEVDEGAGLRGGGAPMVIVVGGKGVEGLGAFTANDVGFGVDAGFESVHAGDGFALDGARAGGFLSVEAVGLDLPERCHNSRVSGGRAVFGVEAEMVLQGKEKYFGIGCDRGGRRA